MGSLSDTFFDVSLANSLVNFGYLRFGLSSYQLLCWSLYGGLPMMTLMGFSFCSWTRIQFSSETPPRFNIVCRCTAAPLDPFQFMLSNVSTKQRFGNSR